MSAEIVPARWWEAGRFLSINFTMVRGRDPWADGVLARPWAIASLLEYAYMLDAFARYDNYIVKVSGKPAGVLSLHSRPAFIYIYSLGLLPDHRRAGLGQLLADFVLDYSRRKNIPTAVASVAVANRPAHVLVRALGGRLLGLSTTDLTFSEDGGEAGPPPPVEFRQPTRREAQAAWRRWRLHEVEQVAGPEATDIAGKVLGGLPRAEHRVCLQDGQEIGFVFARRRAAGWEAGLFPSHEHWGQSATAGLLRAMGGHFGAPLRRLTLTQTHADALGAAWPASLQFNRHRDQERHLVFFRRA